MTIQVAPSYAKVKAEPDKAVAYLFGLPVNRVTLTAITPDGPTNTATFAKSTDGSTKAIKWITEQQAAGRNIYYQDCSVDSIGKRPVKADVSLIHCAHADLDVKGELSPQGHARALAAILAVLEGYAIPATDIICTGNGVQAFWYLDTPLPGTPDNVEKIEAINRALAADLNGDSCHDVAHLMRVPFTVNYPNKLKISKGRVAVRSYVIRDNHDCDFLWQRLDSFPSKLVGSKQQTVVIDDVDIPDAVDLSRLSKADRRTIKDGVTSGDRSVVVYAIACAMRRARYSDGEIIATIIDEANGISAHILDQKQREPIAQASRIIARMNEKGAMLPDFDDGYELEMTPEEEEQQSNFQERREREKAAKQEKIASRRERVVMGLSIIRGEDIEIENISFVWQYVLARGVHTAMAGEGGQGKSQVTYSIAAAVTNGGKLPDGSTAPKGNVIILNAEDNTKTMFGPRLLAAGADMSKIIKVQAVVASADEPARKFSLQNDLAALQELVEEIGDVVLIIIDPASSYMGGTLDGRQNVQVRNVLDPISKLAEDCNVAVLSVSHFNKGTSAKAVNRVMDSTAFVTAPRAVWGVFPDPDDMELEARLFVQLKSNMGPPNLPGWSYKMQMKTAGKDQQGKAVDATCIVWTGKAILTADQIVAAENEKGAPRTDEAVAFLRTQLADRDPPPYIEEVRKAADEEGITQSTLNKAKRKLGVEATNPEGGMGGPRRWILPKQIMPELDFED
jgi:hypothetical protein